MRIAVVRQRYNPYGGAERFVARALDALARQGAEMTIVAREWAEGGAARTLKVDPFYVGRLWRDRGFARAVCARLAAERFDLVQSHERLPCCDVYRAGDGVHRQWLENRARAAGPVARLADRLSPYHRYVLDAEARLFASPRLRAVICNSRMVRDEIRTWFGLPEEKLHVVYNGVDLDAFVPALRETHRARLRAELGVPEAARVFLHVGSGFARKGVATVIAALARLGDRTARLLVVGKDRSEGAMRAAAARAGVAERVHFAGGQDDVKPWYGAADCFVLATLYDPFPNAALEALASGLPAVVSRQCGAAELVKEGVTGRLVDALDVVALARAMEDIAGRVTDDMREHARASVTHLGLDAMGERMLALYRTLLGGNA
ncbi:MAG TPA: glycosyltransferase family 4 protein [Burkholderiales bacterium]|nr:glycosyltransferase family 4 protein [Burkholderiales bacterium]